MATKSTNTATEAVNETEAVKTYDPYEMVEIKLFKDGKTYKDDVFVAVNGKNYLVQRGVKVAVPRCVAEVIERSERQRDKADELIHSIVSTTEAK